MLVPYPGTRDFDYFFSETPPEEIDWDDFVAIGEKCVLSKNAEVPPEEIERLIARANIRYYANPIRIFNLIYHIRTLYEFSNYIRGGLSFLRQIAKWQARPAPTEHL
jgi:hypothetical protein